MVCSMKKIALSFSLVLLVLVLIISCKKGNKNDDLKNQKPKIDSSKIPFDSSLVKAFFVKYPKLSNFQKDIEALYKKRTFHYVWFDGNGINEIGNLMYDKINNIKDEGVQVQVPYKAELDNIFKTQKLAQKPNASTDLLISSLYFYYASKVFEGLDTKKFKEIEWYLPQKKQSYADYLDSLLVKPSLINKDKKEVLGQYYRLKQVLKKYREIEKKGAWNVIEIDSGFKSLKPGDSSNMIVQIRQKLKVMGDLETDSKSAIYDEDFGKGVLNFKLRHGNNLIKTITKRNIDAMNVPISERIKTIMVNMERCRWISNDISKAKEFVVINIPAYKLTFYKNGKPVLISNVVVGKKLNKTVIFSADLKYIVFSPYWNLPQSIIKNEVNPAIEKNPNYLEEHNMERVEGNIRQKPGPRNSLGLIKFIFPNSNDIYLHDTPAKGLFNEEKRAFSHGCIRVQKVKELAELIMENDPKWNATKIDSAMHSGKEHWYTLKNKIPVYIGYFTAWVDDDGKIHFYDDVYKRDEKLSELIFEENKEVGAR